ncbi:beta-1,4-glucuronyltransferase 1-like [Haematobia irritans]|uniref:beta-1,4-glucuronyltransferase 1-like n=1 Tax=Haematobia irritans TaxID=7368 RepID=UPI003F50C8DF
MLKHHPCMHRRNFEIFLLLFLTIIACVLLTHHVRDAVREIRMDPNVPVIIDKRTDKHHQRTMELKSLLKCYDRPLTMERLQYGNYWLLKNLIRGRLSTNMGCAESITYTTIGDYTFMGNLRTVVKRWMGPISFALFAPGYDFNSTMDSIQYVRHCLPESPLIRDYVTFHIYFPNDNMPYHMVPLTEEQALKSFYDCRLWQAPYENVDRSTMYKTKKNLTYPINVGRNIARFAANTYFIFASDIELNPSLGLIDQFLDMAVNNISLVVPQTMEDKPRVFPMPVFEIQWNATLPDTKEQLVAMLRNRSAIPFHSFRCRTCHLVPNQEQWIKANKSENKMEIFSRGKRHGHFKYWEPFYISNNKEPMFDERVTWEGQSNKRIQNYAMCLLDYEYHVLYPAFVVHAPGIKKSDTKPDRLRYVWPMNKMIRETIVPEYQVLYGENKNCTV